MSVTYDIIFVTGGTGGHTYPAIAVAKQVKKMIPDVAILFVGSKYKMEMTAVPQAGFPIIGLPIKGLNRMSLFKNFSFPFLLTLSLFKAIAIVLNHKPKVVAGFGGFASFSVLKMAQLFSVPTIIQEQNSVLGLTNKYLAKSAKKICIAFETLEKKLPPSLTILTGNPVREEVAVLSEYDCHGQSKKLKLLIIGGSLGAEPINGSIKLLLEKFLDLGLEIHWQTGKNHFHHYKQFHNESKGVYVYDYFDNIVPHYSEANIIVSRAGASTISELTFVGKPVVFIPLPSATENHQYWNAKELSDKKAAILIPQNDFKTEGFYHIKKLTEQKTLRDELSKNILKLRKKEATQAIANEILKYYEAA